MHEMERRAAQDACPLKVTYQPGSWDKRFAGDLSALARGDDWQSVTLSLKQRKALWNLVRRYRRQIKDPGLQHWANQQLARIEQEELADLEAVQAPPRRGDGGQSTGDGEAGDQDQAADASGAPLPEIPVPPDASFAFED